MKFRQIANALSEDGVREITSQSTAFAWMRSRSAVKLRLTKDQLNRLKAEVEKRYPFEACGLLFGNTGQQEVITERIVLAHNVLRSSVRFEIDSKEFYDALAPAEKDGLAFLGFFHSHPAQANPSSVDLHFMKLWADAVWLIFSVTENKFAAFQLRKNKVHRLFLKVVGKLKE